MRGSIIRRYKNSWTIVLDLDPKIDPATGKARRNQKWISVKGTKREAETRLNELLTQADKGQFIEPSKLTLGEWLTEWLGKAVKPPARRLGTYNTYKHVIDGHILKSPIAGIRLQRLKATDLKGYYSSLTVSSSTQAQHHAILHSALKAAVLDGLVPRNVASLVVGKPKATRDQHADIQVWTADEARRFLTSARADGPQSAAFYTLALETGMRKGELCGLKWGDVDFERARVSVVRQLVVVGPEPEFGPPKNGKPRTIDIAPATVQLLRAQRQHQAEIKMRNRRAYQDYDLVFAKEWGDLHKREDSLGKPLQMNNIGQREFAKLVKASGVKRIRFHDMRHTCATLLLQANVPAKVVQERLGHKRIQITLDTYAHVLPSMQQDAAALLSSLMR